MQLSNDAQNTTLDDGNPENDQISLIKRDIYRKMVIFDKFIETSIV